MPLRRSARQNGISEAARRVVDPWPRAVVATAAMSTIAWPRKTRELHSHHFDSTIWNDLAFRDDDIVIATYAKSGTTWMQQIIAQLLFDGDPDLAWPRCRRGSTCACRRRR